MKSITFKLPTEMKRDLEAEAEKDGRTVSDFIRRHFQKKLRPARAALTEKGARK